MPANLSAVVRHRVIDACLNSTWGKYPSLQKLADECSRIIGSSVSTSTIEKDFIEMKKPFPHGYSAPIVYNKLQKGYFYAEAGFSISELNLRDEEWEALRFSSALLYQFKDISLFANFKSSIEKIDTRFRLALDPEDRFLSKNVQFETSVSQSGYEWLEPIYHTLRSRFLLRLMYENIYKKETREYILQPVLLREHRNRWYVVCWSVDRNAYRTFSLDRIKELVVIEEKQPNRHDFDPDSFLQNSTGIMEGEDQLAQVELQVRAPFDRLLELEPLHQSQTIIEKDKDCIRIRLEVNINPEFNQRLLSMGPSCTVLSPVSLRDEIRTLIDKMRSLY